VSLRVRVKEHGLRDGRVSFRVAAAVMNTLHVALRAEAASLNAKKQRGRLSSFERESIAMSLTGIEVGSGTMVWESEAVSLFDVPGTMFDHLIAEANRVVGDPNSNASLQKALLALEPLFQVESPVEWIEFRDDRVDRCARVDRFTVDRIRLFFGGLSDNGSESENARLVGRLLELDLAAQTFRLHGVGNSKVIVEYEDVMEPLVRDALKQFVVARVAIGAAGQRQLVSLEVQSELPESRFDERRSLAQIIAEQRIKPLDDFASLALEDPEAVSNDVFDDFIKNARRGSAG